MATKPRGRGLKNFFTARVDVFSIKKKLSYLNNNTIKTKNRADVNKSYRFLIQRLSQRWLTVMSSWQSLTWNSTFKTKLKKESKCQYFLLWNFELFFNNIKKCIFTSVKNSNQMIKVYIGVFLRWLFRAEMDD